MPRATLRRVYRLFFKTESQKRIRRIVKQLNNASVIFEAKDLIKDTESLQEDWILFNGKFSLEDQSIVGLHNTEIDQFPGQRTESFLIIKRRLPKNVKILVRVRMRQSFRHEGYESPLVAIALGAIIVDFFSNGKISFVRWRDNLSWDTLEDRFFTYDLQNDGVDIEIKRIGAKVTVTLGDNKMATLALSEKDLSSSFAQCFSIGNACSEVEFSNLKIIPI